MKAEIMAVGTELLLGDIVNTNAQYIAKELASLGIDVYHQSVVGDNPERLKEAIEHSFKRSDIIITTGGLGPTKDDLTKEFAAEYFNKKLVVHKDSLEKLEQFAKKIGRKMAESNKKQVFFPEGAIIIENNNGTAPGCIIEDRGKYIIMLPGPPREMIPMFRDTVIPYLKKFSDSIFVSKVLRLYGIGESEAAEKIDDIIEEQNNPTVAPYVKDNSVTLRITAKGKDEEEASELIKPVEMAIREKLGLDVYGEGEVPLEEVVAAMLVDMKLTVSTAESCTGGLIAATLIDYPGISSVFNEGFITYSNEAKIKLIGVKAETLDKFGAVSEETAKEMVEGLVKVTKANVGIAVTGIAGPGGGTEEKPVGLVYGALSINGKVEVKKFNFPGNRQNIRKRTVFNMLDWLRRELLNTKV